MPTFVVTHNDCFMKVVPGVGVVWTYKEPNTYPSKYAAKRHLKQLDNIPDNIKIVELLTTEDNFR